MKTTTTTTKRRARQRPRPQGALGSETFGGDDKLRMNTSQSLPVKHSTVQVWYGMTLCKMQVRVLMCGRAAVVPTLLLFAT